MADLPLALWVFLGLFGTLFGVKALYGLSIALVLPVTRGALYVSSARNRISAALDALDIPPGGLLVDLGCGDGRVLRSAVLRTGIHAEGYELNPLAYGKARLLSLGLARITLYRKNFWKADLSGADGVFCYLFPDVMPPLARKLRRELKPGARVASSHFPLPGWVPERILRPGGPLANDPVYIYRVPTATGDTPLRPAWAEC
jgi:SAM-dependent methyltransferase